MIMVLRILCCWKKFMELQSIHELHLTTKFVMLWLYFFAVGVAFTEFSLVECPYETCPLFSDKNMVNLDLNNH